MSIHFKVVVLVDFVDKVFGVFSANMFDPKAINNKRELNWMPFMMPPSRDEFALIILLLV